MSEADVLPHEIKDWADKVGKGLHPCSQSSMTQWRRLTIEAAANAYDAPQARWLCTGIWSSTYNVYAPQEMREEPHRYLAVWVCLQHIKRQGQLDSSNHRFVGLGLIASLQVAFPSL